VCMCGVQSVGVSAPCIRARCVCWTKNAICTSVGVSAPRIRARCVC